jgi:hypothetical protein
MENANTRPLELTYDQEVFLVIGGEGEHAEMLVENDNLVIFESLWHAGPLVRNLQALGITAQVIPMMLYALYCLARALNLGLWVLRYDGTIASIDEIV